MVNYYVLNIKDINFDKLDAKWNNSPKNAIAKALKHKNPKDKLRSLSGEILVRYALQQNFSLAPSIEFSYKEKGKPFLSEKNIHFNISHSGDWVVCSTAQNKVGIDVEKIKKEKLKVANRFFSEREIDYLSNTSEEKKDEEFTRLWTIKEAYLKFLGTGLTKALNTFTAKKEENGFVLYDDNILLKEIKIHSHKLDNENFIAVCYTGEKIHKQPQIILFDQLLKFITK
ncbi:MAG: 4'-phosphopantetheinyl transferase superfamily protein [Bacteroidota bacterium]|nr:4'-phosphopantetheinyl transferase superfamily protein [Bacteroidota bacterium]